MREIKFRAKRIDDDEWVYGYLYKCNKFARIITAFAYTNEDGENEGLGQYYCEAYDVDINTISQFTGLYDKNGKEIYENDIVKAKYIEKRDFSGVKYDYEMEFIELVVWKEQSFKLEINNCGIKMYRNLNFYENINNIKLKELEVIGNIFDNPELLEEV